MWNVDVNRAEVEYRRVELTRAWLPLKTRRAERIAARNQAVARPRPGSEA